MNDTAMTQPRGLLNDPTVSMLVIAALVKRLGGDVTITQQEIDEVAYNRVYEQVPAAGGEIRLLYSEKAHRQ